MLHRDADALDGQEQDRQIFGRPLQRAGEIAVHDHGIDARGQMRPVLLDGRDGQDGDHPAHVAGLEVGPGEVRPETIRGHGESPLLIEPGWRLGRRKPGHKQPPRARRGAPLA